MNFISKCSLLAAISLACFTSQVSQASDAKVTPKVPLFSSGNTMMADSLMMPTMGNAILPKAFIESAGYAQLFYIIDVGKTTYTPFFRYDTSDPNDKIDHELGELTIQTYGLNIRPIPNVTIKLEYHLHTFFTHTHHKSNEALRDFKMLATSISIAF